jgi:adenine C2-methylase RlmN of 23S rRNA A2503 and tRNA A37
LYKVGIDFIFMLMAAGFQTAPRERRVKDRADACGHLRGGVKQFVEVAEAQVAAR